MTDRNLRIENTEALVRISNKQNVYLGGPKRYPKKATLFTVHRRNADGSYRHVGQFYARGWSASDAQCRRAYYYAPTDDR